MAGNARNYGPIQSFLAGAAIEPNRALKLSAANTVIHTTAITDSVIGFSLNKVASGAYVDVLTLPGAKGKARAGAAISLGAQVMPEGSGDGDVITAAGATAISCGIALQAAADGETFEVLFRPGINAPASS